SKIHLAGFSEKRPSRVLPIMTEMTVMLLPLLLPERKTAARSRTQIVFWRQSADLAWSDANVRIGGADLRRQKRSVQERSSQTRAPSLQNCASGPPKNPYAMRRYRRRSRRGRTIRT